MTTSVCVTLYKLMGIWVTPRDKVWYANRSVLWWQKETDVLFIIYGPVRTTGINKG